MSVVTSLLARASLISISLVASFGCSKESPPAAEEPRSADTAASELAPNAANPATAPSAAAAAPSGAAPAEATAGSAKFSEATFDLTLAPKGAYKASAAGEVEILLSAKAPFHVNDQYPYKFKLKPADGVKFASDVVGKDAVKLATMTATMPVAFTPEKSGKHTIAGQFSFSVCSADKCLIEKRDLALEVSAE